MPIEYRLAAAEDAAALSGAARDSFVETFGALYPPADLAAFVAAAYSPAQQLAELLTAGVEVSLALTPEGDVEGFCHLGPLGLPIDPGVRAALEVKRLYVRARSHGAGVGPALLEWAIARARARGAAALFLGVWSENARAQRFYARYGFQRVGEYLFPVGSVLDEEHVLRLDLL